MLLLLDNVISTKISCAGPNSSQISFLSANSADPDANSAFYGISSVFHCLPKYLFRSFQYIKG